ncbi:MAG: hypothetical protein J0G94_10475, partial [Sphingomonadales bacterium]|nr:hypothetical protein [Sphingomonadales bacterium]
NGLLSPALPDRQSVDCRYENPKPAGGAASGRAPKKRPSQLWKPTLIFVNLNLPNEVAVLPFAETKERVLVGHGL